MMSTGIVRRTDDLGRIAIPKEIRRTMNIREGDPLEIYTVDNGICFKKTAPVDEACLRNALDDWLNADCEKSLEAKNVAIALRTILNREKTEKKGG